MENEMITVREISRYLRISMPTVYRLLHDHTIPHVKIGCRYIIPREAFFTWVASNALGGDSSE